VRPIEKVNMNILQDVWCTKWPRLDSIDIGDRDPKHRAEEIIRICDVTGNKKLSKEEVNATQMHHRSLTCAHAIVCLCFFFI
jgi:hypothetical protein